MPDMWNPAIEDRRYAAKRQVAPSYNYPAPIGGINARDGLTEMKPTDAIALTNVFPEAGYLVVRNGFASNVVGLGGGGVGAPIRTLMVWRGATDRMFGCAGTGIWQAYIPGATGAAAVTGLGSVDMQWTNIRTAGGQYLIYVNGIDSMGAYDGTNWTIPVITVATSSTFQNVCQFKERLWFAQASSLDLYYLPTQAIAGAAVLFPLGSVFRRGGYISNLGAFSRDAGEGPDDFFVIFTNNGEVAIYQGTDPASANTWALVGLFEIGKPIGRRATCRLNGDLTIITQDGVVSCQALLQFGRESIQKAAITGKIQTLFSQYAESYFSNFGWQPCVFPAARYLVVNVPTTTNTTEIQLVMNTITGAWCQFDSMNGGSWAVQNNEIYFGAANGTVYKAHTGFLDEGAIVTWNLKTSWQMPGGAKNKRFTLVRPTTLAGAGTDYDVTVDVDFKSSVLAAPATSSGTGLGLGMVWPWTWPGTWASTAAVTVFSEWHSVGTIGTWASIQVTGRVTGGACQIQSFELVAEPGGVL